MWVYGRLLDEGHRSVALGLGVWMLTLGVVGAVSNIMTT